VPEELLRQFLLKNLIPDGHGGYQWRIHLEAIADNYDRLRQGIDAAQPFNGETLFLLGGKSDYVAENDRKRIHELFPRAQFESIPGAGHWVHAEKPAEFAGAVLGFLK
jgi:esterase